MLWYIPSYKIINIFLQIIVGNYIEWVLFNSSTDCGPYKTACIIVFFLSFPWNISLQLNKKKLNNLNQTTAEIAVLLHNQNLFIMSGIL